MQKTSWVAGVGITGMLGLAAFLALPEFSTGQPPAAQMSLPSEDAINPTVADCNVTADVDTRDKPAKATPITSALITSGQPCAETVTPSGLTNIPLIDLQRGFDFYSWLTFMALNSPAAGAVIGTSTKGPDPITRWENPENYRQLADIMLPEGRRPVWGMPVVPPECRSEYKSGMMIIKVIEESFNQPFKSGPLIDQNGRYALLIY